MILVGYTSASAFPQCFNISEDQKILEKKRLQNMYVEYAEKYVELFNPKFFFPFAGRYTLAGRLAQLNIFKGANELEEAYEYATERMILNLEAKDAKEGIDAFLEKRNPEWKNS